LWHQRICDNSANWRHYRESGEPCLDTLSIQIRTIVVTGSSDHRWPYHRPAKGDNYAAECADGLSDRDGQEAMRASSTNDEWNDQQRRYDRQCRDE
jgi:hypothetical protein